MGIQANGDPPISQFDIFQTSTPSPHRGIDRSFPRRLRPAPQTARLMCSPQRQAILMAKAQITLGGIVGGSRFNLTLDDLEDWVWQDRAEAHLDSGVLQLCSGPPFGVQHLVDTATADGHCQNINHRVPTHDSNISADDTAYLAVMQGLLRHGPAWSMSTARRT